MAQTDWAGAAAGRFDAQALEAYIQQYQQQEQIPGISVCVTGPQGVLFEKGFGKRNDKGDPMTVDTIQGIGSMSKSITAACIALLVSQGKMSFDDPIVRYYPGFRIPGTPENSILIRHLLNHTTGLPPIPVLEWSVYSNTVPDPWEEEDYRRFLGSGKVQSPVRRVEDIVDYIGQGQYEPLGQPGEYMSYSNECLAVLCGVIDQVAGMSFEEFSTKYLFEPLGMDHTVHTVEDMRRFPRYTSLYTLEGDIMRCSDNWMEAPPYRGCGFIKSTPGDMCKYYGMLANGGQYQGRQVMPACCVEWMVGKPFAETEKMEYCFALEKQVYGGQTLCFHGGAIKGVSAHGGFIKDQGFAVTVLTNRGGVQATPIWGAAMNLLLGQPVERSTLFARPCGQPTPQPSLWCGAFYDNEEGDGSPDSLYVVENQGGQLLLRHGGQTAPLRWCGANLFWMEPDRPLVDGKPVEFYIRQGKPWAVRIGVRMYQVCTRP